METSAVIVYVQTELLMFSLLSVHIHEADVAHVASGYAQIFLQVERCSAHAGASSPVLTWRGANQRLVTAVLKFSLCSVTLKELLHQNWWGSNRLRCVGPFSLVKNADSQTPRLHETLFVHHQVNSAFLWHQSTPTTGLCHSGYVTQLKTVTKCNLDSNSVSNGATQVRNLPPGSSGWNFSTFFLNSHKFCGGNWPTVNLKLIKTKRQGSVCTEGSAARVDYLSTFSRAPCEGFRLTWWHLHQEISGSRFTIRVVCCHHLQVQRWSWKLNKNMSQTL